MIQIDQFSTLLENIGNQSCDHLATVYLQPPVWNSPDLLLSSDFWASATRLHAQIVSFFHLFWIDIQWVIVTGCFILKIDWIPYHSDSLTSCLTPERHNPGLTTPLSHPRLSHDPIMMSYTLSDTHGTPFDPFAFVLRAKVKCSSRFILTWTALHCRNIKEENACAFPGVSPQGVRTQQVSHDESKFLQALKPTWTERLSWPPNNKATRASRKQGRTE